MIDRTKVADAQCRSTVGDPFVDAGWGTEREKEQEQEQEKEKEKEELIWKNKMQCREEQREKNHRQAGRKTEKQKNRKKRRHVNDTTRKDQTADSE